MTHIRPDIKTPEDVMNPPEEEEVIGGARQGR